MLLLVWYFIFQLNRFDCMLKGRRVILWSCNCSPAQASAHWEFVPVKHWWGGSPHKSARASGRAAFQTRSPKEQVHKRPRSSHSHVIGGTNYLAVTEMQIRATNALLGKLGVLNRMARITFVTKNGNAPLWEEVEAHLSNGNCSSENWSSCVPKSLSPRYLLLNHVNELCEKLERAQNHHVAVTTF